MNRKQFLIGSGKSIFLTALFPWLAGCNTKQNSGTGEKPAGPASAFSPDIELELTAEQAQRSLLEGNDTAIYSYKMQLIKGPAETLTKMPDSYLGPVLNVKRGQKIRIHFKNNLTRESVIHWHGLHLPPEMDGHPKYAVGQGEEYIYEFEIMDRPGTYWFHPHPDKITGPQVYHGLAGLFLIDDDNESRLPRGKHDLPLIIQDRTFDNDNQLVYINNRMEQMNGFLGDTMLVNGKIEKQQGVSANAYRLRVLNGSNSRIYKLAWKDGSPLMIIGTDGGLLEKPVNRPYLMLAPGERIEVWKDFSSYGQGDEVILESRAFNDGSRMGPMGDGGMGPMGDGMMGRQGMMGREGMMGRGMGRNNGRTGMSNGDAFNIMTFRISGKGEGQYETPSTFAGVEKIPPSEANNIDSPRTFHFHNEHMQWAINGETFGMNEVADWEKVKLNTTEIWEFINGPNGDGGMGMGMMDNMMQMPHPVHVHGLQFQIIERDITEVDRDVWSTVKDGFLDEGWQDTFLIMPGMKVKVIMRFKDFSGMYIYHCHNLEHEDMGMMRNYLVEE